jgi:hypothetical protein
MIARGINHLAVIAAAVAYFLLGAIWYMFLFGAAWSANVGAVPTGMGATPFIIGGVMSIVLAYVIAIALKDTTHPQPARHGVEFGIFMGVGIFATQLLMDYSYAGRPIALWAIDAGYVVVGMALMGAIIGAWRSKA